MGHMAKTVTIILLLPLAQLVSNIRHQYRFYLLKYGAPCLHWEFIMSILKVNPKKAPDDIIVLFGNMTFEIH